jgi:hypothetical protein
MRRWRFFYDKQQNSFGGAYLGQSKRIAGTIRKKRVDITEEGKLYKKSFSYSL